MSQCNFDDSPRVWSGLINLHFKNHRDCNKLTSPGDSRRENEHRLSTKHLGLLPGDQDISFSGGMHLF